MIEFVAIFLVVAVVALALAVLAFMGVMSVGLWLKTPRQEQRIVLGCLGMVLLVTFLLWLWVNSLPSTTTP
jgi:NADH:ubiquinone oxidoreductase subunit 6 (subunit J)